MLAGPIDLNVRFAFLLGAWRRSDQVGEVARLGDPLDDLAGNRRRGRILLHVNERRFGSDLHRLSQRRTPATFATVNPWSVAEIS